MSIMNILAQIMSGQVQVDPKIKSQIAMAMAGQEPQAPQGASGPVLQQPQSPQFTPAPAADPRLSPQQPIQSVNSLGSSPVASVMAGQDQPEGMPPQQEPQQAPMQAPQQASPGVLNQPQEGPGILSRMGFENGNQALGAFGAALAAAGSQDPAKTALLIQQQRAEEAKNKAEQTAKSRITVKNISGTPIYEVNNPVTGEVKTFENETLAKFYATREDQKVNAGVERILLQGKVTQANQQAAVDNKAGGEARSELSQVRETISSMERALEVAKTQGKTEQIFAIPGISAAAEFFGAPGAAGNKVLQELKVNDALRMTAQTKGAISNAEMSLFMSPAPNPTADREMVWKPWIENKISVFKRLEKVLETTAGRDQAPGTNLPTNAGSTNTPPASSGGVSSPTSKAAYDALPAGTQYVAPDGKTYTKR